MASSIVLSDVVVDFPIYQGSARSLKKTLLRTGSGGHISRDAGNRVVVRAIDHVDLRIDHGERIGLIGSNGAGKTTLLRVLAGVYEPVRGVVDVNGAVSALFDIGFGLNPESTGYENIMLRGLYMGLTPKEIASRVDDIAEFTELGDYLSMPIRTYSSGMVLRLAFGVVTSGTPDILLMDEWLLTGDSRFLEKARARLEGFVGRSSILVLASHAEQILRQWCSKLVLVDAGRITAQGEPEEVLAAYHEGLSATR